MWNLNAASVQRFYQVGQGDMGARATDTSPARFWIPDEPVWVLVYVRAHFQSGSGRSDIIVARDSVQGSQFDMELERGKNRGTGEDYFLGIPDSEHSHFGFDDGDILVIEWENPEDGTMEWGLEVGLAPAVLEV